MRIGTEPPGCPCPGLWHIESSVRRSPSTASSSAPAAVRPAASPPPRSPWPSWRDDCCSPPMARPSASARSRPMKGERFESAQSESATRAVPSARSDCPVAALAAGGARVEVGLRRALQREQVLRRPAHRRHVHLGPRLLHGAAQPGELRRGAAEALAGALARTLRRPAPVLLHGPRRLALGGRRLLLELGGRPVEFLGGARLGHLLPERARFARQPLALPGVPLLGRGAPGLLPGGLRGRALGQLLVARVLRGLQLVGATGQGLEPLLLPQLLEQLERALDVAGASPGCGAASPAARPRPGAARGSRATPAGGEARPGTPATRSGCMTSASSRSLRHQPLVERAPLGGHAEALAQPLRRLADPPRELLLAVEGAAQFLLPLERARARAGRGRRLPGDAGRATSAAPARRSAASSSVLCTESWPRSTSSYNSASEGKRSRKTGLTATPRPDPDPRPATRDPRPASGGCPAGAPASLSKSWKRKAALSPGSRPRARRPSARATRASRGAPAKRASVSVRPGRVRVPPVLEPQLGQPEVVLPQHLVGHLLAGGQVHVALGQADAEQRGRVGERA